MSIIRNSILQTHITTNKTEKSIARKQILAHICGNVDALRVIHSIYSPESTLDQRSSTNKDSDDYGRRDT